MVMTEEATGSSRRWFARRGFDSSVAARVREARWRPSQSLEPADGGAALMTVTVGSAVETLPWILGWGAHCEV